MISQHARRLLYESEMKRVRGMERDIAEFEQEVNRLTQLIAPDFPQLPPVDQAIRLNEDCGRAGPSTTPL